MAAPQARRLELTLAVKADTAGAKAGMDQLAAAADKAQKAMSKAQKEAEAAQQKAIRAARIARDTASGAIAGVYDRETGKTTYRRGAGSRFGDAIFGTPAVDATTGQVGSRSGGLLANVGSRFGITPGMAGPAAAAAVAYQAAVTSKAVIDSNRDELLTTDQRARQVFKSVPFGDTVLSFAGTLTGRDRDMARAQEENQRAEAASSARTQFLGQQLSLQSGVTSAQARAGSLSGARAVTTPYVDRSTATGERLFRLETQRAQAAERGAAADRESQVAKKEAEAAERRANELAREGARIDQRRADAQRAIDRSAVGQRTTGQRIGATVIGGFTGAFLPEALDLGGPDRARRLGEFDRLGTEFQSNAQMQADQLRQAQEARNRQIAAEGRARGAREIGSLQIQAGDLEERAARSTSNAQRVALSDRDRVQEAIYAAERFARGGIKALDPSEIGLLREFGAADLDAAAEREGKNDPRLRRLARLLPQTYPDGATDPETLRRQANDARNRAAEIQLQIDRDTATATANVVKNVADTIERVFKAAMDQVEANILRRQQGSRGV